MSKTVENMTNYSASVLLCHQFRLWRRGGERPAAAGGVPAVECRGLSLSRMESDKGIPLSDFNAVCIISRFQGRMKRYRESIS